MSVAKWPLLALDVLRQVHSTASGLAQGLKLAQGARRPSAPRAVGTRTRLFLRGFDDTLYVGCPTQSAEGWHQAKIRPEGPCAPAQCPKGG